MEPNTTMRGGAPVGMNWPGVTMGASIKMAERNRKLTIGGRRLHLPPSCRKKKKNTSKKEDFPSNRFSKSRVGRAMSFYTHFALLKTKYKTFPGQLTPQGVRQYSESTLHEEGFLRSGG